MNLCFIKNFQLPQVNIDVVNQWIRFCVIFLISVLFASCSSTVLLSDGTKVQRPSNKTVMQHLQSGDIEALIYDHTCQSKKNQIIYDYLNSRCGYGTNSYLQLINYTRSSSRDVELQEMFTKKKEDYETIVLKSLSSMTISDVAKYYKSHNDEHVFLDDAIQSVYINGLEGFTYEKIRVLDNNFQGTKFSNEIHPVRIRIKNELMPDVMKVVEEECNTEFSLLDASKRISQQKVLQLFPGMLDNISNQLLDDDMPKEKKDILAKYNNLCNSNFPRGKISTIVNGQLAETVTKINSNRRSLSKGLVGFTPRYSTISKMTMKVITPKVTCPINDLVTLSKIQHDSGKYTEKNLILDVAGFLTTGVLGAAVTAYDIYSSYQDAKKDAQKMSPYLRSSVMGLGKGLQKALQQTVDSSYSRAKSSLKKNQELFKKSVYESF
jgi:hypothetical protein